MVTNKRSIRRKKNVRLHDLMWFLLLINNFFVNHLLSEFMCAERYKSTPNGKTCHRLQLDEDKRTQCFYIFFATVIGLFMV